MIVQFFSRGKGRGAGPIDYLLGRQGTSQKTENKVR